MELIAWVDMELWLRMAVVGMCFMIASIGVGFAGMMLYDVHYFTRRSGAKFMSNVVLASGAMCAGAGGVLVLAAVLVK